MRRFCPMRFRISTASLLQVSQRLLSVTQAWHSAKVIRTREKVTFFLGVMSLLVTALLFGMAPEYVFHICRRPSGISRK